MAARAGRRRTSMQTSSPLRWFYGILALVAVVGIALMVIALIRPSQSQTVNVGSLNGYQSMGNPSAPVTVVEYADFQCPGCAYFATNLEAGIRHDYIDTGKVYFVYHEFPLDQHPDAVPAAEAARCAADQHAF